MKWFLIEFWHFVTTSNILGVVFGLVLGTWWKRQGKLEIEHIPDLSLFSENERPYVEKIDKHAILVNVFNQFSTKKILLFFLQNSIWSGMVSTTRFAEKGRIIKLRQIF